MAFRKGVVHLVGCPGGRLPFLSCVLSVSAPMRCATAGCAQCRWMELMACLSRSLVLVLLAAVRCLVACCFMQFVTHVLVPMACPRSLHPSVSMFSGCRIVVRCVSISCCFADVCGSGPTINLTPVGVPSSSKHLMNHSTSCSGRKRVMLSTAHHNSRRFEQAFPQAFCLSGCRRISASLLLEWLSEEQAKPNC
jgi:hypothetical protein